MIVYPRGVVAVRFINDVPSGNSAFPAAVLNLLRETIALSELAIEVQFLHSTRL